MIDSTQDGISHINVYSKGRTKLGRLLTNFARVPFTSEDGEFDSIEGYWYWLSTKDDQLRKLSGYAAKKLGRELRGKDWDHGEEFKRKIKAAISIKIYRNKNISDMLKESSLPFKHYYVYGKEIREVHSGWWILDHIENIRSYLQAEEFDL